MSDQTSQTNEERAPDSPLAFLETLRRGQSLREIQRQEERERRRRELTRPEAQVTWVLEGMLSEFNRTNARLLEEISELNSLIRELTFAIRELTSPIDEAPPESFAERAYPGTRRIRVDQAGEPPDEPDRASELFHYDFHYERIFSPISEREEPNETRTRPGGTSESRLQGSGVVGEDMPE